MTAKYTIPQGSLISFFSNKVKQLGGINLAQGLPGFAPPNELKQILSEIATRPDVHQYAPGIGNFTLIDHIVQHYSQYGTVSSNEILITQGATEAITLVYLYLKQMYGKLTVLGFDPVYESYNNLPKIFGDRFISFDLTHNAIDYDKLEWTIKNEGVHLIFLNSPGNPLGRIATSEEVTILLQLSNKYSCYLLIDAVYREIYFTNMPVIPFDTANQHLFYVNSFSKLYSITGWRVGYLICNAQHMLKIRSMHDYTGLCVSNPIQTAIAHFITQHGFVNNYVHQTRNNIYQSFLYYSSVLKELNFQLPPIDGGYFIWARLPEPFTNGFDFAVDLYEQQKVAVIPGIHFSPKGHHFVRFNIAHPIEVIQNAAQKLKQFISANS